MRLRVEDISDATLVGRFLVEDERGTRSGSFRLRYAKPALYRVDAFESGAPGAAGGTSFLVEGDSAVTYVENGRLRRVLLGPGGGFEILEGVSLRTRDLEALALGVPRVPGPRVALAAVRRAGSGYAVSWMERGGSKFTVWIDREKRVARRALSEARDGTRMVDVRFAGFRRIGGAWWPTRIQVRHLPSGIVLRLKYDAVEINTGLVRDDLQLRGGG